MLNDHILTLAAVAYAPKVVTIWEGFKQYFADQGLAFDFILYSNYETQIADHLEGRFHVAWNSPLAWVATERVAKARGVKAFPIAMRDTDQSLVSLIVVRADSTIGRLSDLKGKRIGVGSVDSPQATLIPLVCLAQAGMQPYRDFDVQHFDQAVGKHGDHIGGERDAARALIEGRIDAACMADTNHLLFSKEGVFRSDMTRVLTETGQYDHCNFTVLECAPSLLVDQFRELLLSMSYADPKISQLLELEGLKAWKPGRVEGYALLNQAIDQFSYLDAFLQRMGPQ